MPRHAEEWDSEKNYVVDDNGDVKPATDFLDGDGTVIEAPDERVLDVKVDGRLIHESAAAALRLGGIEHEQRRNPHWPMTVEDVIAERQAKAARATPMFERDDPYSSLGGGLQPNREVQLTRDEILEDVLKEFEPWHVDVRTAVEQFGVVDYKRSELTAMDTFDKYSLHFYGFMQAVEGHIRLITKDTGGDVELDSTLSALYPGRTPQEMLTYAQRLTWLQDELDATGIPQAVCAHLEPEFGKLEGWKDAYAKGAVHDHRLKATDALKKFRSSHKNHTPQLTKDPKGKPKLEFV